MQRSVFATFLSALRHTESVTLERYLAVFVCYVGIIINFSLHCYLMPVANIAIPIEKRKSSGSCFLLS